MTSLTAIVLSIAWVGGARFAHAQDGHSINGSVRVLKKKSDKPHDDASNAVVWLSGATSSPPSTPVEVNQFKKKFRPRVLPVVKGQVVHFVNQDSIEHNVFSTEPEKPFDLGRYPKGEYGVVTFDKLGRFKVYCNIHKSMLLDIVVVPSSHYAVSTEDGVFSIEGVPDGEYVLNIWHIYGGAHTRNVMVRGDSLELGTMDLKSTRVIRSIREHLNKQGRPYKKKKYRDR